MTDFVYANGLYSSQHAANLAALMDWATAGGGNAAALTIEGLIGVRNGEESRRELLEYDGGWYAPLGELDDDEIVELVDEALVVLMERDGHCSDAARAALVELGELGPREVTVRVIVDGEAWSATVERWQAPATIRIDGPQDGDRADGLWICDDTIECGAPLPCEVYDALESALIATLDAEVAQ